MKRFQQILLAAITIAFISFGCSKDTPIDEDGLLITERQECFVSNFELLGADFITVRAAILDYLDSNSKEKKFLPIFLSESISDFHYTKDPKIS